MVIALVLSSGLILTGCNTGLFRPTWDPALNGWWGICTGNTFYSVYIFANGHVEIFDDFHIYGVHKRRPIMIGTFTTNNNILTITYTHIYGGEVNYNYPQKEPGFSSRFYTLAEARDRALEMGLMNFAELRITADLNTKNGNT